MPVAATEQLDAGQWPTSLYGWQLHCRISFVMEKRLGARCQRHYPPAPIRLLRALEPGGCHYEHLLWQMLVAGLQFRNKPCGPRHRKSRCGWPGRNKRFCRQFSIGENESGAWQIEKPSDRGALDFDHTTVGVENEIGYPIEMPWRLDADPPEAVETDFS